MQFDRPGRAKMGIEPATLAAHDRRSARSKHRSLRCPALGRDPNGTRHSGGRSEMPFDGLSKPALGDDSPADHRPGKSATKRWPLGQTAFFVVTASTALWAGIIMAIRLLIQ